MEEYEKMRKKSVTILIAAMLVGLISGCGQKQVGKAEPTVSDAAEDVVEAGIDEALDQATDVTDDDSGEAEDESVDESEVAEVVEEEPIDGPAPFLTIADAVSSQDKSADYGVNSTSCYDLDQFLDSEGRVPADWFGDDKIMYEYSGRWAYPEINPCDLIVSLTLNGRSDYSSEYSFVDSSDAYYSMSVFPGLDDYRTTESMVGMDFGDTGMSAPVSVFTAQTEYGDTEVYDTYLSTVMTLYNENTEFDEEGNAIDPETGEAAVGDDNAVETHTYSFHIGNFSVQVITNNTDGFSQEDLEKIIDSFELVGERAVAE